MSPPSASIAWALHCMSIQAAHTAWPRLAPCQRPNRAPLAVPQLRELNLESTEELRICSPSGLPKGLTKLMAVDCQLGGVPGGQPPAPRLPEPLSRPAPRCQPHVLLERRR